MKDHDMVCMDVDLFLEGLPLNLVKGPSFHKIVNYTTENEKRLKWPYFEVKVTYLEKEVENVDATLNKY